MSVKQAAVSLPTPTTRKPTKFSERVPLWMKPYVQLSRLDMLSGSMLVFWPCAWGLTMAARKVNLPLDRFAIHTALYFVGSVILHSAVCIWDDMVDVKFDRQVERTKSRPLAAGTISKFAAVMYMIPQLAICLGLLYFTNETAFYAGLVGVFFWDTIYPFMKRITYWPQSWLGVAMNWGVLVAWISLVDSPQWIIPGLLLFSTWCWTMHYDTCYGAQDKKDDVKAGVKSTAILFGNSSRTVLSLFSAGFLGSLAYVGVLNEQGPAFFIIAIGGTALHLIWQLATIDFDEPASCFQVFASNGNQLGYIVWAGTLLDYAARIDVMRFI